MLPLAAVVALAAWCASRAHRAKVSGAKPDPPDPWLME